MSAPTKPRHRRPRIVRSDSGAPVWIQLPWELQRAAMWLAFLLALTLWLSAPTPHRLLGLLLCGALLAGHWIVGPDTRDERCGY